MRLNLQGYLIPFLNGIRLLCLTYKIWSFEDNIYCFKFFHVILLLKALSTIHQLVMIHLVFGMFNWFWIMRWIMPSLTCLFHCLYLRNPRNNFYMRGKIFCPLMEKIFITFFVTDFIDILNLLLVNSYNFRINFFDLFSFL